MIKYTWQNYEQLPSYEPQPPGTYFFKVMFAEHTIQGGSGITCGSIVIIARIAIPNNQGEIVNQWKERFILHPRTAWKWEAFLKCINFRNGEIGAGEQVQMQLREIVGCKGRADIALVPMEPRSSSAGSSVFVGQQQQPNQQPQQVRYKNEVAKYHDNIGAAPDLELRAEFDLKCAEMEAAAEAAASNSNPDSFYPPANPNQQNWSQPQTPQQHQPQGQLSQGQPSQGAFPKPGSPQQPFPKPNLGQSPAPGYPQPNLPGDEEIPF